MGLLGLLGFGFDVLAWPLFALLYPLYSSIRAIETNSIADTYKLNTYWVVFSLILLFEHAFMKLLECFLLWPYMRLLIVFYLVIPHFDGALYVYKHLVCPCLSMDPQILFSLFKKESLVRENFLSEVERYVKENGYEGLEKFISSKSISKKPNSGPNDNKPVQVMVKKKETTANQDSEADPIFTVNKDRSSAIQMNEKTIEVAPDRALETPPPKNVQKEQTAVSSLPTQTGAKTIEVAADRGILKTLPPKNVQKQQTAVSPLPAQTDAKTIEVAADRGILKTLPSKKVQEERTEISPLPTQTYTKTIEVAADGGILNTLDPKKVQGEMTPVCPLPIQTDATFNFRFGDFEHKATYEAVKINNETKPDHTLTENHTVPAVKINGNPVEVGTVMEHSQSPKQVQKEWKHKGSYDSLKARNQAFLPTIAASTSKTSDQPNKKPGESIPSSGLKQKFVSNEHVQSQKKISPITKVYKPKEALVDGVSSNGLTGQFDIHLEKVQSQQLKPYSPLWCAVCSIRCSGEIDMMCHLKGRKHKENEQQQKNLIKAAGKGRKHKENEQQQKNLIKAAGMNTWRPKA